MMKKILVTGFEPFNNEPINPSIESVKNLPVEMNGASIIKMEVPSVFFESIDVVIKKIKLEKPDMVIMVGQAGGRNTVAVERVAINIDDARIPDNLGNRPIDRIINADDSPAYFATIPIKAIVSAIKKKGIPVALSNSAGTFICNHLMYGVLSYISRNQLDIKCGFIHVPYIPEQAKQKDANTPSLPLSDITTALEEVVVTSLSVDTDIKEAYGFEF